jgi:sugar/nucleoside kinase (ribokinase family)
MDIVCVGDCGIDRFLNTKTESFGGCTLNVAMNLILPNDGTIHASVVTALSAEDARSREISDLLSSKRIALCASLLPGKLPVQNIFVERSGERTFKGYEPGILADWKPSKFQIEMIANADIVVTLAFEQIVDLFEGILAIPRRGRLSVDFMDMTDFGKDIKRIDSFLNQIDIAFFGLSKNNDQTLIADIKRKFQSAVPNKLAVMTFGSEGSMVVGSGICCEQPAEPVTYVVNTTGAGDSFAAVFLTTYLTGKSIPDSLKVASRRAASVVQMKGAF